MNEYGVLLSSKAATNNDFHYWLIHLFFLIVWSMKCQKIMAVTTWQSPKWCIKMATNHFSTISFTVLLDYYISSWWHQTFYKDKLHETTIAPLYFSVSLPQCLRSTHTNTQPWPYPWLTQLTFFLTPVFVFIGVNGLPSQQKPVVLTQTCTDSTCKHNFSSPKRPSWPATKTKWLLCCGKT